MSSPEPVQSAAGEATQAGVIGLGMIGSGIAVSLARSGITPVVYDVRPEAVAALGPGAAPAASAARLARDSDVVLISVFDAKQAMSVLTAADGVLAAARDSLIVVVLSTVTIRELRELDTVCAQAGVTLLDAGVSDGSEAARNGLVVMVGGPDDAVARALPVLEGFSKKVVHCGPLGAGMAAKLARNALTYTGWAAAREAATIAEAGGVPLDRLFAVLEAGVGSSNDPITWLRRTVEGQPITPEHADFIDALAQKDLAAAQELAGEADVEVPLANVARPRMRRVFGGELGEPLPEDPDKRGRAMMDRVLRSPVQGQLPGRGPAPVERRHHRAPVRPDLEPAAPDRPRPAADGDRGDRHAGRPCPVGDPDGQRVRQRRIHPRPAARDRGVPAVLRRLDQRQRSQGRHREGAGPLGPGRAACACLTGRRARAAER